MIQRHLDTDRIIEMAWEDRTQFEAIKFQFQLCSRQKSISNNSISKR